MLVCSIAVPVSAIQFDAPGQRHVADDGYDGRFTFVRLRWGSDYGFSRRGGFGAAWNHDYPRAEQHLGLILKELTAIDIRTDINPILALDDPGALLLPDRPHVGTRLLEPDRSRGRVVSRLPGEGRLRRVRRLRRAGAVEQLRDADAAGAARGPPRQARQVPPHLRLLLSNPGYRCHPAPDVRHRAELLRHLRGQQSGQTADGGGELRQRRARGPGNGRDRDSSRSTRRTRPTSSA